MDANEDDIKVICKVCGESVMGIPDPALKALIRAHASLEHINDQVSSSYPIHLLRVRSETLSLPVTLEFDLDPHSRINGPHEAP